MKREFLFLTTIVIFMVTLPFIILLLLRPNYDTEEEMLAKCSNLVGLNGLVLNKTTISDIYKTYKSEDIRTEYNSNTLYSNVKNDYIEWKILNIENFSINGYPKDIELHFYRDTLIKIEYYYPNYDERGQERKYFPKILAKTYGYGIIADKKFLDSISYNGKWSFYGERQYHRYINGDINMIVGDESWNVDMFHKPKLLDLFAYRREIDEKLKQERVDNSNNINSAKKYIKRGSENDEVYWNSIRREKMLKDAGMYDAARIEKNARQRYLQGEGYTAPDGSGQIHFQGSKEQEEQLRMMDELGW